jgi:hypothetical protein
MRSILILTASIFCTVAHSQSPSQINIGPLAISSSNTASTYHGPLLFSDIWNPPSGSYNQYSGINLTSSLNSGTVAQRWATSNNINSVVLNTTGPSGTPSSPSGMADSHTIAYFGFETIPADLCDGQNGSGFGGPGGSPGNNCYQEVGGFENTATILSPGHYAEGIGSYVNDNNGGSGVPIRGTGFLAVINKANGTNSYPLFGFQASSTGTQQTTYSPNAAYRVDGGWQIGLDLTGATYTSAIAIAFPFGPTVSSDASHLYFSDSNTSALILNHALSTFAGAVKFGPTTFASLPSCSGSTAGTIAYITDASAPITAWHQQVTAGSGANKAFIACNGSGWYAFDY